MRLLQIDSPQELNRTMQQIRVDVYGIKIMLPKAITRLIRINSISCISANILKQEMLSLGGDVAVARGALTGKTAKTDCLLIGSLAQFNRLAEKLNSQPFGLNKLSQDISGTLANYQKEEFVLNLGKQRLNLKERTFMMGILNLTPDSFSRDGLYRQKGISTDDIVRFAQKLVKEGSDIIDVGGESTRPEARPVTVEEELKRTIPVIKKLSRSIKTPISIDTYKPEVAEQALDNGAVLVNDITALRNPSMAKIIRKYKCGVVLMHMRGTPFTMQKNPFYTSLLDEIIDYLNKALNRALSFGIEKDKIIIDPGIGFGKTTQHNLEIIKNLKEFKVLGYPILVGASRKSFIGRVLNLEPQGRVFGTVSSCVLAAKNGANILRVHDVSQISQALKVSDAINRAGRCRI